MQGRSSARSISCSAAQIVEPAPKPEPTPAPLLADVLAFTDAYAPAEVVTIAAVGDIMGHREIQLPEVHQGPQVADENRQHRRPRAHHDGGAYAAFYAALEKIGATVEPAGDFYKIVETSQVASTGFRVYGPGANLPTDGRIVTKVWRPAAGLQAQTASFLTELKTDSGVAKTVGDVVIVTGTGARVRTLERLLADLEQPPAPHRKVHLYGVRHADAEALSEVVRPVFDAGLGNIAAPPSRHHNDLCEARRKKCQERQQAAYCGQGDGTQHCGARGRHAEHHRRRSHRNAARCLHRRDVHGGVAAAR